MARIKQEPTGKERAFRIRLDHYKSPDSVSRAKWWLTFAALVAAVGWVVWALATPQGAQLLSHGPLSEPHAMWESDCQACHVPGVPLSLNTVALDASAPSTVQRCQSCHRVVDHHSVAHESDQSCSRCHREHRGRQNDLSRIASATCTSCHADLVGAGNVAASDLEQVTGFPDGHPEFRSLSTDGTRGDPGQLGFSHSRHMRLGLTSSPDSRESEWFLYSDLPESERSGYQREGQESSDRVQLDCNSCHQLHTPVGTTGVSLSAVGAGVFLPVKYEQHCRACHPLTVEPRATELLPHGLSSVGTAERITRAFRSEWFDASSEKTLYELKRPVPGRSKLLDSEVTSPIAEVEQRITAAKQHLRQQCQQCHLMKGEGLEVEPTNVPAVWLPKSSFDHFSHRAVGCRECHPAAYKEQSELSLSNRKFESQEVMIPPKENCAQCHAPQTSDVGGVRYDCILCHRYHQDGVSLIDQGGDMTIQQLLHGAIDDDPSE
ncbi:MAG: cytochrome c3 family protein [Aeoliella sp.]